MKDLEDFGVVFDKWISERKLYHTGEVQRTILKLKELGYVYEKDGALWFKSTAFGDDKDRVIIKMMEHTLILHQILHIIKTKLKEDLTNS